MRFQADHPALKTIRADVSVKVKAAPAVQCQLISNFLRRIVIPSL
jgi:hypothetical protein